MNMIALIPTVTRPKCPHCLGQEQRFVLHDITWQDYQTIGRVLLDRPKLRMTYDRGTLEFMTTSNEHEYHKKWLGRLIETLAEEHNLSMALAGNMTFEREDILRGFEPDECYWIAHEAQRRGRTTWDPFTDPPPDLTVEIEVSRGTQDRMAIFASFGVAEVWCYDGSAIRIYVLQPDRIYRQVERSPIFPAIPPDAMVSFLQPNETLEYLCMIRAFRAWVREQIAKNA